MDFLSVCVCFFLFLSRSLYFIVFFFCVWMSCMCVCLWVYNKLCIRLKHHVAECWTHKTIDFFSPQHGDFKHNNHCYVTTSSSCLVLSRLVSSKWFITRLIHSISLFSSISSCSCLMSRYMMAPRESFVLFLRRKKNNCINAGVFAYCIWQYFVAIMFENWIRSAGREKTHHANANEYCARHPPLINMVYDSVQFR